MNWIYVKDRMPDDYETVLVTDGMNIEQSTYARPFGWIDTPNLILNDDHITHWCAIELP